MRSRCKASWSITANDGLPARKSSLVRSDTGNGACEILYVTGFEVQHAAAAWPRGLFWLGILLSGGRGGGVCAHTASRALNKATSGL